MSRIRADKFVNNAATGAPQLTFGAEVVAGVGITGAGGINITGVATAASFDGNATGLTGTPDITVNNITGVAATFSGVLTYEDVTNIDSVGIITAQSHVSIADSILHTGDTDTAIRFPAVNTFTVETAGSEAIRVDSSGRVLIGTSSAVAAPNDKIQINSSTGVGIHRGEAGAAGPRIDLTKSRNATHGSNTIVQSGDLLGSIFFRGDDGTDYNSSGAQIFVQVDGTPGANDMPGRLVLATSADGSASPTERLRITSTGGVHFNNAELIERVNIVGNKLSAAPNVNLDNGMAHYYTTNETTTATPNIISTAGINTNMATGDTISVTILSKPNNAGYFPKISIDGVATGITTYWNGGSAPSSAESSGVDANTYQIIKTADATYDVLANTSNFA